MGSHNILSQTDLALVAYLISENAGTEEDIYPAKRSGNKVLPDTICHSSEARQMVPHSGVYVVKAMVQVRTDPCVAVDENAEDKKEASEHRVRSTFNLLSQNVDTSSEELANAITQAGRDAGVEDFTVQSCTVESQSAGFNEKGNGWLDTIDLELVVCPKDVS